MNGTIALRDGVHDRARKLTETLAWLRLCAFPAQALTVAIVAFGLRMAIPLAPLALGIGALAAFAAFAFWRLRQPWPVRPAEAFGHIAVDIGVLAWLLYFSGGVTNPFVSLLVVPIALAAAALPLRYVIAVAGLAAACYVFLVPWHVALPPPHAAGAGGFNLHVAGTAANFAVIAADSRRASARPSRQPGYRHIRTPPAAGPRAVEWTAMNTGSPVRGPVRMTTCSCSNIVSPPNAHLPHTESGKCLSANRCTERMVDFGATFRGVDELDSEIVRLLQTDARQSNRELARRLGIAPSTCLERVRALTRRPQEARDGVTWIAGALDRPEALADMAVGSDAVMHIAGVVNVPTRADFEAGNAVATANVVEAARGVEVRRFIHVSSLAAREPGLSNYGWSKERAERVVEDSGLDWTIVRPPAVFGPGDTEMLDLFRMAPNQFLGLAHSQWRATRLGRTARKRGCVAPLGETPSPRRVLTPSPPINTHACPHAPSCGAQGWVVPAQRGQPGPVQARAARRPAAARRGLARHRRGRARQGPGLLRLLLVRGVG